MIDFNQKEEITIPGMNNGTGTMTAKMHRDEQGKQFVMGRKKFYLLELATSVRKALSIVLLIQVMKI